MILHAAEVPRAPSSGGARSVTLARRALVAEWLLEATSNAAIRGGSASAFCDSVQSLRYNDRVHSITDADVNMLDHRLLQIPSMIGLQPRKFVINQLHETMLRRRGRFFLRATFPFLGADSCVSINTKPRTYLPPLSPQMVPIGSLKKKKKKICSGSATLIVQKHGRILRFKKKT